MTHSIGQLKCTPPPKKKKHHSNVPSNHHLESLDPFFTFLTQNVSIQRQNYLPVIICGSFVGKSRQVHYSAILQGAHTPSLRQSGINKGAGKPDPRHKVMVGICWEWLFWFSVAPAVVFLQQRGRQQEIWVSIFYICRFWQEANI